MLSFFQNIVAGLSERERRLVGITSALLLVFIIFLLLFFVQTKIGDLEDENLERAETLALLEKESENYLQRLQENQALDRSTKPTPLRTLVDKIGKQLSVTVPDIKELPDQRHGSIWLEHAVELSMRQIGLRNLTSFMEEVEAHQRKFPIAISKLEIRKRKRTPDAYDVNMVISTYEKTDPVPTGKKRGSSSKKKGGR
jgi:hypothetical protein